jgi:WD40 repeat protein
MLAAVTGNGQASIWDVESRSLRHGGIPAYGQQVGVAFSKDGSTLAVAGSAGIGLWSPETGKSIGTIPAYLPYGGVPAFSDDGALLAVGYGGGGVPLAEVWDVASRSLVAEFEGGPEGDALALALTPDGEKLALGGYGKVVRIWDVRTRKRLHVLDTGRGGSTELEFSADGRTLAVAGFGEPAASLWDVENGTRIGPSLTTTAGRRTAMVDLSSDGRRLLLTLANGEGAVFDVDPVSWTRRACTLANRTLTREEWERFLPGRPYEPACAS